MPDQWLCAWCRRLNAAKRTTCHRCGRDLEEARWYPARSGTERVNCPKCGHQYSPGYLRQHVAACTGRK